MSCISINDCPLVKEIPKISGRIVVEMKVLLGLLLISFGLTIKWKSIFIFPFSYITTYLSYNGFYL